jgi:hypothetical protein
MHSLGAGSSKQWVGGVKKLRSFTVVVGEFERAVLSFRNA